MDKRGKQILLFSLVSIVAVALFAVLILNSIFAAVSTFTVNASLQGQTPTVPITIVEDALTTINFSIIESNATATGENNITGINVTLPVGVNFTNYSGLAVSAFGASFSSLYNISNNSGGVTTVINFMNESVLTPLVKNGTNMSFWFNVTVITPGRYNITINASYGSAWNSTNVTLNVSDITPPSAVETFNATQGGVNVSMNTMENGTSYNTTTSINLSCNATDNDALASVTVFVVGTPWGPTYTNSSSISGTYNQTNMSVVVSEPGTYKWYCQVSDTAGNSKSSKQNYTFSVNAFSISGWVKNSSYNNVSGANITIYEFVQGQGGPPTQRIIKSTITTASGQYNLTDIRGNTSSMMGDSNPTLYKIKVTLNNSDGLVTEIGPTLPTMPSRGIFYNMNGGTLYLQNATTFQLYAYANITNSSTVSGTGSSNTNVSSVKFGYEVMDQALGFPIESSIMSAQSVVNVTVAANRNYTVMFVRDPYSFTFGQLCRGPGYMNESDCPAPPSSISITSENIYNGVNSTVNTTNPALNTTTINSTRYLITVNKSLSFSQVNLTGCLNIVGNTSDVNVTDIIAKMVPWTGFVPPIKGEVSNFDATENGSLKTDGVAITKGCTRGGLGMYNLTLMGSASGIEWMIEAYAGNRTSSTAQGGDYFAVFQNITMTGERVYNLTLRRLLGTYNESGDVNTSKIAIAVVDSNGTALTSAHVELYVKNPVFGTMHYVIESLSNGIFNFPFLNNTQEAKVMVYSNMYAPKEQKINLTANKTTVTVYSFRPQMMLDNGSVSDQKMSANRLTMKFMRYSSACNVYTPSDSCQIGGSQNGNFEPMQAMMAGKSNLWMKTSGNVTLYFINVDMMASGPPDAMMNDNASSATASSSVMEQVWKFGSMAPNIYDQVFIGIPYNSSLDENWTYRMNMSMLYDNDWRVVWNATANGSGTSQIPSDYSTFNSAWFGAGMNCTNLTGNTAGTASDCFMNTTNADGYPGYFWFKIPHFTITANKLTGAVAGAPATTTSSTGTTGGGGTAAATYTVGTLTTPVTKEIAVGDVISFTIEGTSHTVKVLGMTATSASVQIRSTVKTKLLQVGQPAQEVDVDDDGVNEISISLDSVNLTISKVTLTITPLVGAAPVTPAENVTETPAAATPEEQPPAAPAAGTPEEKKAGNMWLWIGILSVVVVAIVIVVLIQKLKKD